MLSAALEASSPARSPAGTDLGSGGDGAAPRQQESTRGHFHSLHGSAKASSPEARRGHDGVGRHERVHSPRGPSAHSLEHLRSELARMQGRLQGQIDTLTLKVNEGRLNDQRSRHRDRELIMQAIFKQRSDVDERIVASRTEAVEASTKVVEEALVAAMERENSEREKAQSSQQLEEMAILKTIQVCLLSVA